MKTRKQIYLEWVSNIEEIIEEVKQYHFKDVHSNDIDTEDFYELVDEQLMEEINGCQDVIYTYKAKEISHAIDIYSAFDCWELTGERFDNWSTVAFASIHDLIQNEININDMINDYLEELIKE